MKHIMKLWHNSFMAIKSGKKTIEMRLRDEKRSLVQTGDEIVFVDADTQETTLCKVIALHPYDTFADLYARHDKISIGYEENETADPKDMLAYYTQEQIEKYGVLGIEIRLC